MTDPKQALEELEKAEPGTRFQRLYSERQQSPHGGLKNWGFAIGGLLVIGAGVATYPVPVIPSEIVILAGLALVSQGSLRGARILDGAEVRLRRWFAPALKVWRKLPRWARRTLGVVWVVAVSGLSYWAYRALHD